jgi:hypothetical protein
VPAWAPGSEEVVIASVGVPGLTTTLALACFVGSAALVAVTVTLELLVTVGAVNMPPVETEPEEVDHVTAVLPVPCTVAVNCWLLPDVKAAAFGETVTATVAATGLTVTEERADLVVSAVLVAVMVTVVEAVTWGAVNIPPLLIVPAVVVQTTPEFEVFFTVAVNCWLPDERRLDEVGETVTLTAAGEFGVATVGVSVTVDTECLVGSATLVAVTLAAVATVTLRAVNIPLLEIVPPSAVHVTAVLEAPVTVAENCCVPADGTLATAGETVTLTAGLTGGVGGAGALTALTVMYTVTSPWSGSGRSLMPKRKL